MRLTIDDKLKMQELLSGYAYSEVEDSIQVTEYIINLVKGDKVTDVKDMKVRVEFLKENEKRLGTIRDLLSLVNRVDC